MKLLSFFIFTLSLLSTNALAASSVYICDSKNYISGKRVLGIAQQVVVNDFESTAEFQQKNYSPDANWKTVSILKPDHQLPSHSLADRFISEGSNFLFYRTVIISVEDGQLTYSSTSDGVLVIHLENKDSESFLCQRQKPQPSLRQTLQTNTN